MKALPRDEVEKQLKTLRNWTLEGDAIQREWTFPAFRDSIKFVNAVATFADEADHHPDILVRYNRVKLSLWTHDANGITKRDFSFASGLNDRFP